MNVGVTGLLTYLRERDENPNSSRVNNVGNVQRLTVPLTGTITRNIEVGKSSVKNQNQTYNNERPICYPDPGLNVYRDEVRVEVPVGEPYFEQPQVEVNKETYADDAFRTKFNRNAHQRNDGAYRPPKGTKNEVRRGRYNFHDNDRNGNYRNDRNFRNDRNERNDRNNRNRFQEPQRNEFEEPNQNLRQEIGNNAIGLDNIMNMIEQTYDPNLQRVERPAFRRPYPDRVEREYERPKNYKVPDFSTFSGDDEKTAYEHISRFTIQCGEDPNFEVDVAEFIGQQPYVLETTYKKNMQAKGSNKPSAPARTYHFDVDKVDDVFDILLESKYINLPDPRHKIFSKEELRGREHYENCKEETFVNVYQALSLQGKRINSLTTEMEQVKLNQKATAKEKGTYIQAQNIQINQGKMPMAEECHTSAVHNDALVRPPIHTHKPTTCEDALIRPLQGCNNPPTYKEALVRPPPVNMSQ
uniref:Uncharacterized protein n=1 Tax=Fagus sylvatica TaxID=28930 RepID=A0A2N9F974_FAGSY